MVLGALAIVGMGMSIFSAFSASKAKKKEAIQRQRIAEFNAQIDLRNADEAIQNSEFQTELLVNQAVSDADFLEFQKDLVKAESRGELVTTAFRIHNTRVSNRRFQSSQRSDVSGQGLTQGGSALEIMAETAGLMEMGVLEIQRESRIKLEGLDRDINLLDRDLTALAEKTKTEAFLTLRAGRIRQRGLVESANITRMGGRITRSALESEANTALLSGATRFSSDFVRFRQAEVI